MMRPAMHLLTVVRHAKSSWADPDQDDFDRPLNARGERDAPRMAARLSERVGARIPDVVLSSPARRTADTVAVFAAALDLEGRVRFDDGLYLASCRDWIDALRMLPADASHVLICGHNPGLTELVNRVGGAALDNLPTCGVAEIELEGPWEELGPGHGRLIGLDTPKGGYERADGR